MGNWWWEPGLGMALESHSQPELPCYPQHLYSATTAKCFIEGRAATRQRAALAAHPPASQSSTMRKVVSISGWYTQDGGQRKSPHQYPCSTLTTYFPYSLDKGYLTVYSMWCTDACQVISKTMKGTQMTQTCCQSTLCNIPPWQSPQVQNHLDGWADSPLEDGTRHPQGGRFSHPKVAHPQSDGANLSKDDRANQPQGSGTGCPPGWIKFGNIVFLLSFITSLWASGA